MTEVWQPVPQPVKNARMAVMVSYFGILGLFTGDALVSLLQGAPLAVAIFWWVFRVLPLSIFWPGLQKNHLRTYAWLSFAILMYFVHAVVVSFVPGELFYGLLYSLLCTALFCALIWYIRVARKYLGQNLMSPTTPSKS